MAGVRAAWVLLALLVGLSRAAPTLSEDNKRSGEEIQFGNQQNPPVSLLDDDAMAGAFPSSETSEESPTPQAGTHQQEKEEAAAAAAAAVAAVTQAVVAELKEEQKQQLQKQQQKRQMPQQEQREKQEEEGEGKERESDEEGGQQQQQQQQQQEAADGKEQGWDDEANLWHSQPAAHDFYRSYQNLPPRITGGGVPSAATRRRRSLHLPPLRSHPIKGGTLAGMRNLLGRGQEHQKRDLRRFRRDLSMNGVDLDRLLKNVDMKELLTLLSRPRHHQEGYGTVHYAPSQTRFTPEPKLFPDYEEEWEDGAEDLVRQTLRAERPVEGAAVPPGRLWRKSSAPPGYGLARVPGFKRASTFRANTIQDSQNPSARLYNALDPRDIYSLAAMLGAERDPLTHRIRRAAM